MAERERGDGSALDRLDADRLVLDRLRGEHIVEQLEPARGGQALEPAFVVDRPEPRRLRAGRTRGDPHHLVGPARLVEPRAERVSGEHQPFGRVRARPAVRRLERS